MEKTKVEDNRERWRTDEEWGAGECPGSGDRGTINRERLMPNRTQSIEKAGRRVRPRFHQHWF